MKPHKTGRVFAIRSHSLPFREGKVRPEMVVARSLGGGRGAPGGVPVRCVGRTGGRAGGVVMHMKPKFLDLEKLVVCLGFFFR